MSGPRRLAVFLSALWVFVIGFGVGLSEGFGAGLFVGVVPVGFVWGVAWVVAGYRVKKASPGAEELPQRASGLEPSEPTPSAHIQAPSAGSPATKPSIVAVILGLLVCALRAAPDWLAGDYPEAAGALVGSFILPAFLAWAVYGRHKQQRKASFLFAGLSYLLVGIAASADRSRPLSLRELQRIALGETRRMINAELEFVRATASEGMLLYEYRYVNYAAEDLSKPEEAQLATIRQGVCQIPVIRSRVLSRKTSFRSVFTDKAGTVMYTVDVQPRDCGF